MKRTSSLILMLFLLCVNTYSSELAGYGVAKNLQDAKQLAMADLSNQIEAEVESDFFKIKSVNNGYFEESKEDRLNVHSKTKVYGVDYRIKKSWFRKKYRVYAVLSEDKVDLYEKKISELAYAVKSDYKKAKQIEDLLLKREYIEKALENREKYSSYSNIAFLLGSSKIYRLGLSELDLKNYLDEIGAKINGKRVVCVRVEGDLEKDPKSILKSAVKKMIVDISKDRGDRLILSELEDDKVNTVVTVEVNSFHIDKKPEVIYNEKLISSEKYLAYLTFSLNIYSNSLKTDLLDISISSTGYDLAEGKTALNKAVLNGVDKSRHSVEESILKEK